MKINGFSMPGLVVFAVAALAGGPLVADETRSVSDLRIEGPWSRVTPPGTPVGAGYMTIVNTADEPDRLIAAESPAAERVQIHLSVQEDGNSSMVHQKDGVLLPPDARIDFSPGGYHLMLMHLGKPLEEGERVPVTLRFERAGSVEVELRVRPIAADGPGEH